MADRNVSVRLQAQISQYQASMAQAVASTKGLASTISQSTRTNEKEFKTLGVAAGIGAAGLALGLGKMVSVSAQFEKQMSGVQAVANASASEMQKLSDAALAAGASTKLAGVTASDAAKAQAELVKAGISVNEILGGALMGSLSLASAGQLDFAKSAEIAAQAMNIFDLSGRDVGHVADVLAAAANKSASDVAGLGDALRQGGLVAAQTGLSLEETVAALAAFSDQALVGSDAGTSLKTMLQRLTPQSEEAAGMMQQLGFNAYDAQGKFIGLEALAGELETSLAGLSAEQRNAAMQTLFGSDAIRGANVLMSEGAEGIAEYITAVDDQGAAARMAALQVDNLSGDVEALGGALETTFIKNGAHANDIMRDTVQTLTDVVSGFGELPDEVGAAGVAITGVGAAGLGVVAAAGIMLPKIREVTTALAAMGPAGAAASTALGPIALVGAGLIATLALISKDAGAAARKSQDLIEVFDRDLDLTSLDSLRTNLEESRAELARLDEAWLEAGGGMDGFLGQADRAGQKLRETINPWDTNTVADIQAGSSAQIARMEELTRVSMNLEGNLAELQNRLGITEEQAYELAETAGVDLSGAFSEVVPALESAFGAMEAGGQVVAESNESLAAQAEAAEDAADALADYQEAVGEAFGSFTDSQEAYDTALAALEEGARSYAEKAAANTEDASDSWEDHYNAVELSAAGWIESLEAQKKAQDDWKTNLAKVAQVAGADLAAEMAQWGPEGAEKVALFVNSSDEEMMRLGALLSGSARDGMQDAGAALDTEWQVMEAIGRAGASATAGGIAEELGLGAAEVARIAAQYGTNLASGINPVLTGIGKPPVFASGIRAMATGGPVPGSGDGDTVPAMLTPGEFVIRKAAVKVLGVDTLNELNMADRRRYAVGGFVTPADVPSPPSVAGYGTMVGRSGGDVMDHLYTAVQAYVTKNAMQTASGSATGLDPAFVGMFGRYNAALGGILSIISGFRSQQQQAVLYQKYLNGTGNLAARPGSSKHERGLAIDHAPRSTPGMRQTARGYGLHYPVPGEPWHVEPVSIRDKGGPLMPGLTWNGTGRPETVVPHYATGGLIQEDDPRWNWRTMGNGRQGLPAEAQMLLGAGASAEWMTNFTAQLENLMGVFAGGEDVVNGVAEVIDNMVGNTGNLIPVISTSGEQIDNLRAVLSSGTDTAAGFGEVVDNMLGNTGEMVGLLSQAFTTATTANAGTGNRFVDEGIFQTRTAGARQNRGLQEGMRAGYGGENGEDVRAAADAWVALALATDEATATMVLNSGLAASELGDASKRIIDGLEDEKQAWIDGAKAAEAAYELQVSINNNRFERGDLTTQQHLDNLDRRIARETEFTDEWVSLVKQREAVIEDEVAAVERAYTRQVEINNNRFELGKLSTADHLANLDRRLAREVEFSNEWMALYRQRERVLDDIGQAEKDAVEKRGRVQQDALNKLDRLVKEEAAIRARMADLTVRHHQEVAAAERRFQADRQGVIDQRVGQLNSWMSAEERFVAGWGNTAGALTRNLADQLDAFTSWSAELDEARARGVSDEAIDLLGLAEGPEALGQLRALNGATVAEVEALNAAVAARQKAASARASAEAAEAYSAVGEMLQGITARHNETVAGLVEAFLADQESLTADLAAVGGQQGMSYGEALAAGLASQIPAVRAAAAELQSAMSSSVSAIGQMFSSRGLTPNAGDLTRIAGEVAGGRSVSSVAAGLDYRVSTLPTQQAQSAPNVQVYFNGVERDDVRVIVDGQIHQRGSNAAIAGVR